LCRIIHETGVLSSVHYDVGNSEGDSVSSDDDVSSIFLLCANSVICHIIYIFYIFGVVLVHSDSFSFLFLQVLEFKGRDTTLDDALFGFFRKQAVKSLKRNFSEFCLDFANSNKACCVLSIFCFVLRPTVYFYLIYSLPFIFAIFMWLFLCIFIMIG
jgi:hypothetical protein